MISKITRLSPMQGGCAETAGVITRFGATYLGIPVSTTHAIIGSIIGVGSAPPAVRWNVATSIVYGWISTFPAVTLIAAAAYRIAKQFT